MFPYIDDSFIIVDSKTACLLAVINLCTLFTATGFFMHVTKSVLQPTQKLKFLGFWLDTQHILVSPTQEKLDKFIMTSMPLLDFTRHPIIKQVAALVGVMVAYAPAVLFGGGHIKSRWTSH